MAKLYNLARMTTATTGTGTITLGSAVSPYLTFANAGVADADVVSYAITDGVNSEIGTGTYTSSGTTLTRSVTKSTNANSEINLSGSAEVYITPRAEDLLPAYLDTDGTMAADSDLKVPSQKAVNTRINTLISAFPCFSANKNATNQTGIPAGTATKITFTTEEFDLGGYYDAANSKWVPPAGVCRITANVAFASSNLVNQTALQIHIYKNGVLIRSQQQRTSGTTAQGPSSINATMACNGTDYFEIYANAGAAAEGDKTISGATNSAWFCGEMVAIT